MGVAFEMTRIALGIAERRDDVNEKVASGRPAIEPGQVDPFVTTARSLPRCRRSRAWRGQKPMDLVASELIGAAERTAMGGVLRLRAIIGRAYARCRGTRCRYVLYGATTRSG